MYFVFKSFLSVIHQDHVLASTIDLILGQIGYVDLCNTFLNFGGKIFKTGDDHLILMVVVGRGAIFVGTDYLFQYEFAQKIHLHGYQNQNICFQTQQSIKCKKRKLNKATKHKTPQKGGGGGGGVQG